MVFSHLELESDEKIIREVRRHWIVLLGHIVLTAVLFISPLILYLVALAFLPDKIVQNITDHFFITLFFYALWVLLLWVILFINWTNYYLDVWYITDKRIIDIEQKGIFHREISNLRFNKIQDITVEVKGVVATFFKFGNLRVQTAAENSRDFMMKNAARPEEARKLIFEMHNRESNGVSVT